MEDSIRWLFAGIVLGTTEPKVDHFDSQMSRRTESVLRLVFSAQSALCGRWIRSLGAETISCRASRTGLKFQTNRHLCRRRESGMKHWQKLLLWSLLLIAICAVLYQLLKRGMEHVLAQTDPNVRPFVSEQVHYWIKVSAEAVIVRKTVGRSRTGGIVHAGTLFHDGKAYTGLHYGRSYRNTHTTGVQKENGVIE